VGTVVIAAAAWAGRVSRRACLLAGLAFVAGFAAMAGARHPVLAPIPPPFVGLLAGEGVVGVAILPAALWIGVGLLRQRPATRHPAFYGWALGLGCGAIWVAEQGPVMAQLAFRSAGWWLYVASLAMALALLGLGVRAVVPRPGRLGVGASWLLVVLGGGLLVGAYQRMALALLLRWPLSGGG
jgi:hypothetical protein